VLATLLFVATAFGLRTEQEYQNEFRSFMHKHGRTYAHDDFHNRYAIFKKAIDHIDASNAAGKSYTLGVTQFTDLTADEFKATYLGLKPKARTGPFAQATGAAVPTQVDWRKKGAVTPVKNQGQCGSCWSFSSTGSLEGLHFIKTGSLQSYSEQQLVDCSQSYGNQGCDGGLMDDAFEYVASQGIEGESQYPYTAQDGTCQYNAADVLFKNAAYTDVTANDDSALAEAVAQQPVSIAIEADQDVFQYYTSGVISSDCGTQLDHGVLIVGYDTTVSPAYWIVKNSWGASWGEQGYVRIAKGKQNSGDGVCGINMMPSYPTA
jgi:C1A family cysteine protease